MAKFQSPLLGYNNNVRHKNRVFHIQTEDSGVNHPHIITHLFMDGGRILKSVKKSYAEHIGSDTLSETVRQLMKDQHKAMFVALREGQFDHLVDPGAAAKTSVPEPKTTPASEPKVAAAQEQKVLPASEQKVAAAQEQKVLPASEQKVAAAQEQKVLPASEPKVAAAQEQKVQPPAPQTASRAPSEPFIMDGLPPAPAVEINRVTRDVPKPPAIRPRTVPGIAAPHLSKPADVEQRPPARPADHGPPPLPAAARTSTTLTAAQASGSPPRLMLDLDAPPPNAPSPRPPSVAAEPRSQERTVGAYRSTDTSAKHQVDRVTGAAAVPATRPAQTKRQSSRPPEGRYAPSRPASIFEAKHSTRPPPASIFSDDLISDKSLDEVILSYLAEDLEPPRRK